MTRASPARQWSQPQSSASSTGRSIDNAIDNMFDAAVRNVAKFDNKSAAKQKSDDKDKIAFYRAEAEQQRAEVERLQGELRLFRRAFEAIDNESKLRAQVAQLQQRLGEH